MDRSRNRDTARALRAMCANAGAPSRMQWVPYGLQWRTGSEGGVLLLVREQSCTESRQRAAAYPRGLVVDPAVTVSAMAATIFLSVGEVLAAGRRTAYAGSWPPRSQAMLRGQPESHRRPARAAGPLARVVP